MKGLSIQTQQNTFVLFTLFKLTLDEHKTLTKISMCKPLQPFPKPAQTSEQENRQKTFCTKQVEQDPKGEPVGVEMSPKEAPAPEKAPQVVAGGSKAVSPPEITPQRERDLETVLGIVNCLHALCLQILHEVGGMRELEQAAIHTLMSEFARLQSILCEELTKSLSALR